MIVNEKIEEFEINIFMVLYFIKIEVYNLFVKLLDLNKYIMELNMFVLKMMESKLIEYFVSVNKFVSEINYKLFFLKVYNLFVVENDLISIRKMILGIFNFFNS